MHWQKTKMREEKDKVSHACVNNILKIIKWLADRP